MNESVSIRSCTLQDAEAIVSIGIRTFRETFDEMNTPENMMLYINKTFTLKKIREEIQEAGSIFFMAERDDEPVGYARIRTSQTPEELKDLAALEIERMYADKKYLGQRIGHLLMNTCLHYATDHGYDVAWLGVWEHNARAIAFYQKWGFAKFGHHVFMLGLDAQTDFLMKKYLK